MFDDLQRAFGVFLQDLYDRLAFEIIQITDDDMVDYAPAVPESDVVWCDMEGGLDRRELRLPVAGGARLSYLIPLGERARLQGPVGRRPGSSEPC